MRALVTGGSGAIGQAVSRMLAAAGHEVWIHANGGIERAESCVSETAVLGRLEFSNRA